jgi:hypothetical protein
MEDKIFGYVLAEINRLTNNEDIRQDLWVFFLEGNSPFLFKQYIEDMRKKILFQNNMELKYGIKKRIF